MDCWACVGVRGTGVGVATVELMKIREVSDKIRGQYLPLVILRCSKGRVSGDVGRRKEVNRLYLAPRYRRSNAKFRTSNQISWRNIR